MSEDAFRARARTVGLHGTLIEDTLQEIQVLFHTIFRFRVQRYGKIENWKLKIENISLIAYQKGALSPFADENMFFIAPITKFIDSIFNFQFSITYLCTMNLPKDFKNYFLRRWNEEDVEALIRGLEAEPSVSIRINSRCLPVEAEPEGSDGRVPWCPEGFYLKQRPQFTADPLLHAGAYYVQEASSMFLAHVVRSILCPTLYDASRLKISPFKSPSLALDLCAAPGGKSTLLRSLLPDDCLLVSNEPNRARCQILAENLAKWGHPNVLVTQAYPADLAEYLPSCKPLESQGVNSLSRRESDGWVDFILADVPCSGEGMMRKEEEASRQWSPAFVADCAALQRSIICDIWPLLAPGGILIYSTCTFNPEEDEDNVEWIASELGADVLSVPIDSAWGIRGDLRKASSFISSSSDRGGDTSSLGTLPCYHFLPGQVRGEGFFLAILRKHGEAGDHPYPSVNKKKIKKKDRRATSSSLIILPTSQLDSPLDNKPEASSPSRKGMGLYPRVDLSLADSLRYLQRESLILPPDTPRGIVQVCFRGQRLGLMNNLGTRANNLYPKEWRIRSTHLIPHTLFYNKESAP